MGILDDVVINAKHAAESVGRTAEKLVDVSKLRIGISEINAEITKRYQAFGEYIYQNYRQIVNEDMEFAGMLSELDELTAQVENYRKELLVLQNKAVCPTCNKMVALDAIFCSSCGTNLAEVRREEKPQQEEKAEEDKTEI